MAERELTAAVITAITSGTVRPVLFFEGEYVSGSDTEYLRLFTGVGELSWDGKTWTGGRDLLSITPIKETRGLTAIGFAVRLSGLPADKLSIYLASTRKNRPGRLWLGFFDASDSLIADPYTLRRGRFDIAPITRDGDTVSIEARYEDRLVLLERAGGPNGERRYTHADQQLRLAGDRGFEQVPELQDAQDAWGAEVLINIPRPIPLPRR